MGGAVTKLISIPIADLDHFFPVVEAMLRSAYEKMDHLFPDVLGWLKRDAGKLWIAVEGDTVLCALTTSIEQRASGPVLRIVANGGTHADLWKHHLAEIEEWYRGQGVGKVLFSDARPGWARVIPGYHVKAVTLEKVL